MLYALFTDRILQRTDLLKSSFSYSDFPAKRNRFKIFSSVPDLRSFAVYRYFNCERPGKFPFPKKYGGLTRFDLTEKELKKFDRIFLCRPFAFSEELQTAADALGIPLTEIILKPLSNEEMDKLLSVANGMLDGTLPCTACHYCVSHCPQGLDIPNLLSLYNEHSFTGGGFIAPMALSAVPEDKQPGACIGCRSCEAVCPQQIKISEAMADFSARLKA